MKLKSVIAWIVISMLFANNSFAQVSGYTAWADSLFQHLDKSQISTGVFYDRIYNLAQLQDYDSATDTTDGYALRQAYFEIYNASYNQTNWLKPEHYAYLAEVENFHNIVPIGVLNIQFNLFDTLAVRNNLITEQSGLFYDVPGRPSSPYLLRSLQMAAPLCETVYPGTLTFKLKPELCLTNMGVTVQQVQINFPSIGSITLNPGGTATLSFPNSGQFVAITTVNYTNGSSFSVKSAITIESNGNAQRIMAENPCNTAPIGIHSTQTFQGYEESQAYRGYQELSIYYRLNDPTVQCPSTSIQPLHKPVIIIDGFDPTDKRDAFIIYNNLFNYYEPNNSIPINLAERLRLQGYDVVIVNIPRYEEGTITLQTPFGPMVVPRVIQGGGDYIERNALTLVEVINWVKQNMADPTNEKIAIVGPSMGGQISRYALKWMEDRGMDHHCRLWVSMDSPHEGAILPIGLQYLVKEAAALTDKARETLERQINVPSAKQQLIHHHLANSLTPAGAPGFFDRYYASLNSIGWPALLRKVAANSGAHSGLLQSPGSPGSMAIEISMTPKKWKKRAFLDVFYGTTKALVGKVMFAPDQSLSYCQVSHLQYFEGNFWASSYSWRRKYAQNSTGKTSKSLELLAGGFYPGFKEFIDSARASLVDIATSKNLHYSINIYSPNHLHIPTASALAFGKGPNPNSNRKWDDDIRSVNLSVTCGTGEIPFDAYEGPDNFNVRHDSLFQAQAEWLYNEITGNIATIPGLVISGQTNVCNNRPSYFTVNLPPGGSVVWNSSPSGKVTLTPVSSNTVQATPVNSPTGSYTLIATVTASCISTATQTQVFFGANIPLYTCQEVGNGTCTQLLYMCNQQYYAGRGFSVPNSSLHPPYWHWWVSGGKFSDGSTSQYVPGYVPSVFVTPDMPNTGCYVYVRPVNDCFMEDTYEPFKYIMINTGQSCGGYYVMSPNPAASDINVSTIEKTSEPQTDRSITAINIYNQQGMMRKQKKFGKVQSATMSIGDLVDGMYVVEIVSGDYKEQKQLLVKH
jgi:hypothetical protein